MSQNNQNAIQLARGTLEQYKFELQKTRILVSYSFLIYYPRLSPIYISQFNLGINFKCILRYPKQFKS